DRWHDGAPVAAVRNTVCRVDRVPYTGLVHNLEVETEHTYATLAGTVCNCHAAGDVFGFVMLAENLDFGRALRRLADRAGVPLAPRRADDRAARLLAANAAAAELFRTWLAAFGVGWAPEGWDTLVRALGARGFAPAELAAAGLSVARDDGRVPDRFR